MNESCTGRFNSRNDLGNRQYGNRQLEIGNALVECVPNFSEGRKTETSSDWLRRSIGVETACVLDTHIDPDHNRSVITFVAAPEMIVEAAVRVVALAAELIDMRHHSGSIRGWALLMCCPSFRFAA